MSSSIQLETDRLTIRSFTVDDLDDLYAQLSDPEVMTYYPSVLSRDESERWLVRILEDYESNGYGMLALHLKESGEFVGQAGVMRRVADGGEHRYLAYLLRKEFWGQGYAAEAARRVIDYAFETLGIRRIEALVRPVNTPSIRLAERLGMRYESSVEHAGFDHRVYVLTR